MFQEGKVMAISATYIDAATYLSSTYYLRNFYKSNVDARSSSTRSEYSNDELSLADGKALARAIRNLGSFTYDDDSDQDIRNSVSAFISTYNNLISSLSDSDDSSLKYNMKQLKNISSEYSSALDKVGITVNSDGTFTARSSLLSTASLSKFEDLFSADSDYMIRTNACRKRIERRSDSLVNTSLINKASSVDLSL
jgi:hypothetical protein